jgi:hypothetical protein
MNSSSESELSCLRRSHSEHSDSDEEFRMTDSGTTGWKRDTEKKGMNAGITEKKIITNTNLLPKIAQTVLTIFRKMTGDEAHRKLENINTGTFQVRTNAMMDLRMR